jgi:hypothetical protein
MVGRAFMLALALLPLADALLGSLFGRAKVFDPPVVMGDETIIMSKKAHGTSETPVQQNLRARPSLMK